MRRLSPVPGSLALMVVMSACGGDSAGEDATVAATVDSLSTDGDDDGVDGNPSTTASDDDDADAASDADADSGSTAITTASTDDGSADTTTTAGGGTLDPPEGGSSGGSGGGAAAGDVRMTDDGITYRMIAPGDAGPLPLMIVYSGTEGGAQMASNLLMVGFTGIGGFAIAVLDGVQYNGNGGAGVSVLDQVRTDYDVDNDRTYLFSESAGTTAGLELGLSLRQSYFAAYWANDVNASALPAMTADQLGFQPFGNAGPGGDFADANTIVDGMEAAGYRTPEPSPYDGPGAGTHGDPNQFVAALEWFPGKTRQ